MKTRYRLTRKAEEELTDIITYIAEDSINAAEQVLHEFERAFELLSERPGLGHQREDLTDDARVRFWTVYSYLIVFLKDSQPLSITRIVSGHRDVAKQLEPDE